MANTVHVGAQTNHKAAVAKVKGGRGPKKGGGKKGGGGNPIARQAHQQIAAAELPIQQQIKAEKAANLAKAQAQMGYAKAAAAIMQSAAPAVGDAYTGAANADAGYSRALGSGVQAQLDQNQQQSNDFLQKMGTPTGALHQAAPVGDVSYGLQGYIPATTLQREGAGWESAAQLAPGNELHAGQQLAASTLANDPQLASLQGELAKIASTEPAVYQSILKNHQDQAYRQATLSQAQQRIGIEQFRANTSAQQGQERIALEGARLQQSIRQSAQSNKQAWARIGISKANERIAAARLQAKLNASSGSGGSGGGGGGFTPNEIVTIKKHAGQIAYSAFYGDSKAGTKPMPFGKAMQMMTLNGIPPSIAVQQLRAAGYTPGVRGAPKTNMGFLLDVGMSGTGDGVPGVSGKVASRIVSLAHEYLGTPYVFGGSTPKGFDCSGFAQYLYAKVGISIPRTTYTQWQTGHAIPKNKLQPGDLVFFRGSDSKGGLPGHVGIYIGDGMMIDAPHTGSHVRIESVFNFGGYMGARRYGNA